MYLPLLLVLIVLPDTDFLLLFIRIHLRISSLIAFLRIMSRTLWLSGEACCLSTEVLAHSGNGVMELIGQLAFSCTGFFKVRSEHISVQLYNQD